MHYSPILCFDDRSCLSYGLFVGDLKSARHEFTWFVGDLKSGMNLMLCFDDHLKLPSFSFPFLPFYNSLG